MAQKQKEQANKSAAEEPERENREIKEKKKGFVWMLIRENIQDILIGILIVLGLKKPAQAGSTGQTEEKRVPNWVLNAFPGFTRDDENEYNLVLDSHSKTEARLAAEEFEEAVKKDDCYDEIKYIVNIVELRREFMERLKHPVPKDESGGRLSFDPITLRDPVILFFDRLLEEKNRGGSSEEIYERQREIAMKRKLLTKKHLLKRLCENKTSAVIYLVAAVFFAFGLMYFIPYWIFG